MSILYIPTTSRERSDCEALTTMYELGGDIGQGAYGKVRQACRRGTADCDYVLKIIKYDHSLYLDSGGMKRSLDQTIDEWEKEVEVMRKLNEAQDSLDVVFSPKLHDAWYCKKGDDLEFYLLMEKFDGDLRSIINNNIGLEDSKASLILILRHLYAYLIIIHKECHICLNDIKLENILYRKTHQGELQFVFADFGKATLYSDEDCIRIDRESFKRHINTFIKLIGSS